MTTSSGEGLEKANKVASDRSCPVVLTASGCKECEPCVMAPGIDSCDVFDKALAKADDGARSVVAGAESCC